LLAATPSRQPKRELLDQKYFFDLEPHLKAPPRSADHFYILGAFSGEGALVKAGLFAKALIFGQILLGIGLIQMTEYMVRPKSLFRLLVIFKNRLYLCFLVSRMSPILWSRTPELEGNRNFFLNGICQQ
jgi:hypothetical protein